MLELLGEAPEFRNCLITNQPTCLKIIITFGFISSLNLPANSKDESILGKIRL